MKKTQSRERSDLPTCLQFQTGNQPLENKAYKIVDRSLARRQEARPLGCGNVGVVYRAIYKDKLDRAIKFLSADPGGDDQAKLSLDSLRENFDEEISLLCRVTHTNICKIVDFGSYECGGETYPYYVMDYVDGKKFNTKYWQRCSGQDFLIVMQQVLEALVHLHSLGYYHMDVKEDNIYIQSPAGAGLHAVLLDLGGARRMNPPSRLTNQKTTYVSTKEYTREGRRQDLGTEVQYTQLQSWGVDLDFYAIGIILQEALCNDTLRSRLAEYLKQPGVTAVEWVIERLTEKGHDTPSSDRYYKNAGQLRDDLARLHPNYVWGMGLPELSVIVGPHSIQLPSERIGLTHELQEIVNHPAVQRLRNIAQLEYIHLIYPGARHARLEHSLSSFQLARCFLSKLLQFADFRMIVTPEHVQAALLAALLHDVGHYPLSHMFEDFTADARDQHLAGAQLIPSDTALFRSFVAPLNDDHFAPIIDQALNSLTGYEDKPSRNASLAQKLTDTFPAAQALLSDLVSPRQNASVPIRMLHSIIDSAIDIDKISYLTYDSASTGVRFGQGIDVSGLIDALIPPLRSDIEHGAGIAITEEGLPAAEALIMARFWMIRRVYWHRVNRSIMAMHKFVIADLIRHNQFNFDEYFTRTFFLAQQESTHILHDMYCRLCDNFSMDAVQPLAGLLGARRDLYKRLLTITNGPTAVDKGLYDQLRSYGPLGINSVEHAVCAEIAKTYAITVKHGDVIIDMPYKHRDRLGADVLVYLDREPERGRILIGDEAPVSSALGHLNEDYEKSIKKCRVFLHPNISEKIESSYRMDEVRDHLRKFLIDYCGVSVSS